MDETDDLNNIFQQIKDGKNDDEQKYLCGFDEVLKARKIKKDALRQRLHKYHLTDCEIDDLFKIIEKTEEKIEKIKYSLDYTNLKEGQVTQMANKILKVQNEMKDEFEKQLNKLLKKKYEHAKKILEKRNKEKSNENNE